MKPEDFSWLTEEPIPDIFWTELKPGTYSCVLRDILNVKKSAWNNNYRYMEIKGNLISGFEDTYNGILCRLNFPIDSFKMAWRKAPNFRKELDCDVNITFVKVSQKMMKIIKREYLEVKGKETPQVSEVSKRQTSSEPSPSNE